MRHIWLVILAMVFSMPAMAQVDPWDNNFEANPGDSDLVSDGDNQIRQLKHAIRERAEVQHEWAAGVGEAQMGFHLEGSAWALDEPDCSGVILTLNQEVGQLCRESTDQSLWVADAAGGGWEQVSAGITPVITAGVLTPVPQHGIILWDQGALSGDEDCNTVADDGCPCGWTEATEFQGLTIRGADSAAADLAIPDDDGDDCTGGGGAGGCDAAAGATPGKYADLITETQLPDHSHDTDVVSAGNGVLSALDSGPGVGVTDTTGTMGNEAHYHPFRTVLFCRKN